MKGFAWLSPIYQGGKQKVASFWKARQPRERIILAAGCVLVVLLVIYMGLWMPFRSYQGQLFGRYESFQKDLPYIARTLEAYQQLKAQNLLPQDVSHAPLVTQITQMLAAQQLVPFGVKVNQQGPTTATLTFKQAPFDLLTTGIESLSRQDIFTTQAKIHRVNDKGLVSGSITLAV